MKKSYLFNIIGVVIAFVCLLLEIFAVLTTYGKPTVNHSWFSVPLAVVIPVAAFLLCRLSIKLTFSAPYTKKLYLQSDMLIMTAVILLVTVFSAITYAKGLIDLFENPHITQTGIYIFAKTLFALVGIVTFVVCVVSCFVTGPKNPRDTAISAIAAWMLLYLLSECSALISLPDIYLYIPRIFSAGFGSLAFCELRISSHTENLKNYGRMRAYFALTAMMCFIDFIFTLLFAEKSAIAVYDYQHIFSLGLGLFCTYYSLILPRRYNSPDKPAFAFAGNENEVQH